jgi:hypothetical protein
LEHREEIDREQIESFPMKTFCGRVAAGLAVTVLGVSGCSEDSTSGEAKTSPPTTVSIEQAEFVRCVDVINTAAATDLTGGAIGSGQVIRSYGSTGEEYSAYGDVLRSGMTTMAYEGLSAAQAVVLEAAQVECARLHPDGVMDVVSPTTTPRTPEERIDECNLAVTQALTDTFLAATDGDRATDPNVPSQALLRLYGLDSPIASSYRDLSVSFLLAAQNGGLDAALSSTDVLGTCTSYTVATNQNESAATEDSTTSGTSSGAAQPESGVDMRAISESFVEAWIEGDYAAAESLSNPSVISTIQALSTPDPTSVIDCFTDEGGFPLCGTQLIDGSLVVFEINGNLISSVRPWDPNLG